MKKFFSKSDGDIKKPSLNLKKYLLSLLILSLVVLIIIFANEYFPRLGIIEIYFKDENLDRQKREEIVKLINGEINSCSGRTCIVTIGRFMTPEKAEKILKDHPEVDYLISLLLRVDF